MKKIILLFMLLGVLFLISCVPAEKVCSVDEDCFKAKCCHAADAVNKEVAPDCAGQLCTLECTPGTIDCGQGQIKCVSGSCEAVMNEE